MKTQRGRTEAQQQAAEMALSEAFAALGDAQECQAFLRDLCTPAELEALADRWQVVAHLEEGLPYREIHDLTGVSVTTVGRVARFLEHGNQGYRAALRSLRERA